MEAKKIYKPIDSAKFRECLKKRGTHMAGVSRVMGFNESYLKNRVKEGVLEEDVINKIHKLFSIPYSAYEPKPVIEPKKTEEEQLVSITKEEVFDLIYRAVLKAFKEALSK